MINDGSYSVLVEEELNNLYSITRPSLSSSPPYLQQPNCFDMVTKNDCCGHKLHPKHGHPQALKLSLGEPCTHSFFQQLLQKFLCCCVECDYSNTSRSLFKRLCHCMLVHIHEPVRHCLLGFYMTFKPSGRAVVC